MSELPAGWTACSLGDIVERIETGKSVKCDERPPLGSEKGLVKISAVTWGEFNENESKTLFDSAHLKPEEKIQLGDFLISRANTLELVGSCVLVKKLSKNLYLSDKVLRLVVPDEAKHWLLVCLRSQAGRKQIESLATGNQLSMRNISQQALREIRIPLPPLAEQTRIAAKLNELLAQVDTLKARIDGIPALLKRFRQSVLAAAVSGRLTEEWRAQHLPGSDASKNNGWEIKTVSEASANERHSLAIGPFGSNLKVSDYRESGHPLVFVREVRAEAFGDEKTKFVSPEKFEELCAHRVRPGDLLITKMGDPPGDVAVYPAGSPEAVITADCIKFRVDDSVLLRKFAYFQMKSEPFRQKVFDISAGVAQQKVSLGKFRDLPLLIPSIGEQTEIVRRVEQLFAFADQLEAKVNEAKTRIDRLTQSILAKAFRGELVPQNPDDEPASELLARIQAQRAAAPKAKRGRRKTEGA
ncbi:restriction endonuclease subunit S [Pseudomonas sp. B392_1p]|uniref:restriction endonuclease subunit S n=1 Tax=Pseudomonas sp. B392_1p TaxID=3457507 RepID=UPI003FD53719